MREKECLHILLVEDNKGDAKLIQEMLKESPQAVQMSHVSQLSEVNSIPPKEYDVILLDLNLPDSNGLNTVLKMHELLPQVPIVVMTGLDNEELSLSAIQAGAQDYLVKGKTDSHHLIKTIQYALHRSQVFKKMMELNENQRSYFATHDVLTGLPNQHLFLENLQLLMTKYEITKKNFSLFLLEIHQLDKIIATLGHPAKDEIVKKISTLITELLPESVIVARYNENIFALLFPKFSDTTAILKDVNILKSALSKSFLIADQDYFPSYNIGISVFPFDGQDPEHLIKSAQTALAKAILCGGRESEIYVNDTSYISNSNNELILHSDLQAALERQEFFVVYQPQIDLTHQKVSGVEALLRWNHPKLGLVPSDKFIYIAEDGHLITPIGKWVLETVAHQYRQWKNQTSSPFSLRVGVNVSPQQLHYNNLFSTVQNILKKHELPPECLELELTESIFIEETESTIEKLKQIKKLGVQISIDDFGQGYSGLSYLSHLPIDRLKLDRVFVQKNLENSPTSIIVKSIIKLAHSLRLKVIAEGVETKEQLALLKQQQCDEVQGFYYSKPVSHTNIAQIISNGLVIQPPKKSGSVRKGLS